MNKKQRGATLIELLLVFVVIGGIAIAAFVILPSVQLSQRVNNESTRIATIAANLSGTFGSASNYVGLDNALGVSANVFPSGMVSGTAVTSGFGGAVTILPNATDNTFFNIVYAGVPAEACQKLAAGVAANFSNVLVGTTVIKNNAATLGAAVNLSIAGPTGYVAACGSTGSVSMTFTNQ